MSTSSRYAGRGVSSSKEDVHAAIKNIDKGLYPKAFCKIIPDRLSGDPDSVTQNTATSCTPTVQAQSPHWLICTGKKQVIFLFGKALHRMQL